MIKLSNKIISSIVGIVIAGGAITATAAPSQPKSAVSSVAPISSTVSSTSVSSAAPVSSTATVSSQTEVSNVADGVKQIQEATDKGVSAVNEAAKNAVSDVNSAAKGAGTTSHVVKATRSGYGVFDPDNGGWVSPSDPNYSKIKAELGGDAGIVPEKQSTACQKAIAEYKTKHPAIQPSVK